MPRPFAVIGFTVFFTIALLFNSETGVTAAVLGACAAALVVTLFIGRARKNKILPCVFASAAVACALLLCAESFTYRPAMAYDGKSCEIKAVLTDSFEEKYGNYYCDAKAVYVNGEQTDLKLRLVFSTPPEAEAYDIVEGKFRLYRLGASNDDFLLSHKANGAFLGAYPEGGKYMINSIPENEKTFAKKIVDLRASIKNAIFRVLPNEKGALAVALLIGDRSELPDDILNDFNAVGISHIISVSGFHLSLWSLLILKILRKIGIGEKLADLLACFGVVGFMFVAGLTYSVMRSGIMMLIYLLANIISRKRDPLNSLGFALTLIALYNPFAMGAAGLQLSALATLGLILYYQFFGSEVNGFFKKIQPKILAAPLRYVCEAVFVTAAATAFILPVSLKLYRGFNFAVFLANPVIIPLAEACMIICAIGALIGLIPIQFYNFAAVIGGFFAKIMIKISDILADWHWLSFKTDYDKAALLVAGLLVLCVMAILLSCSGKSVAKLACVLCAAIFTFSLAFSSFTEKDETRINVIDCGNGTSVLVSSNGKNYLFGCGGTEFLGSMYVCDAVDFAGGSLEAVILPDSDEHCSAWLNKVLAQYKPEKVYCNSLPQGSELLLKNAEIFSFDNLNITENISVKSENINGSSVAVIKNEDVSLLICYDSVFDYSEISNSFDVVISRNDYPDGVENQGSRLLIINVENQRGNILEKELADKGIHVIATAGCGNAVVRAENGYITVHRER